MTHGEFKLFAKSWPDVPEAGLVVHLVQANRLVHHSESSSKTCFSSLPWQPPVEQPWKTAHVALILFGPFENFDVTASSFISSPSQRLCGDSYQSLLARSGYFTSAAGRPTGDRAKGAAAGTAIATFSHSGMASERGHEALGKMPATTKAGIRQTANWTERTASSRTAEDASAAPDTTG